MADVFLASSRDDDIASLILAYGRGDLSQTDFNTDVRYDHLRQRWLIWNGTRWRPDMTRRIYDLLRLQGLDLHAAADADGQKRLLPLFDNSKKEGVLKSLSARKGIAMQGNEWDTNGKLLGFDNGIVDLESGTFFSRPDPALLVSKSVGIDWVKDAECPRFDWFLDNIMGGDAEMVAYLWRLIGYSLIGTQAEQKFWMWVGKGSNGKGVLARTLAHCFGEYAETPADTMYMRTRQGYALSSAARPDLMRLQAARFTYMSEPPGGQFNEEMLKAHTGEDMIIARDLYGKSGQMAQFTPTHTIVFLTNDPPKTDDVGTSMSRRVRVVHFDQDYSKNPELTLEDALKSEKAGILNRAMNEAYLYLRGQGLPEPAAVTKWSREYIEDNDPLIAFIEERCTVDKKVRAPGSLLWGEYQEWAVANTVEPMSKLGFLLALGRRFDKKKVNNVWQYQGIKVKSAVEQAEYAAE